MLGLRSWLAETCTACERLRLHLKAFESEASPCFCQCALHGTQCLRGSSLLSIWKSCLLLESLGRTYSAQSFQRQRMSEEASSSSPALNQLLELSGFGSAAYIARPGTAPLGRCAKNQAACSFGSDVLLNVRFGCQSTHSLCELVAHLELPDCGCFGCCIGTAALSARLWPAWRQAALKRQEQTHPHGGFADIAREYECCCFLLPTLADLLPHEHLLHHRQQPPPRSSDS